LFISVCPSSFSFLLLFFDRPAYNIRLNSFCEILRGCVLYRKRHDIGCFCLIQEVGNLSPKHDLPFENSAEILPISAFCRVFLINCRATLTDCRATFTNCRATFTNCRATFTNCRATFTNCRATFINCRATFINCRATFINCKATFINCRATNYIILTINYRCRSILHPERAIGS
jgi:hypothetical protein